LLPPLPHSNHPWICSATAGDDTRRAGKLPDEPPAGIRARILAKVREYEALDPNERELRLRATELRWYLLPLLHESPTNRAARLAAIPDDLRPWSKPPPQWDILPPPLQEEFLESERALRYFTHVDLSNSPPMPPMPPDHGWHHGPPDADLAHWNTLSEDQRQKSPLNSTSFLN
jgi:hypothetical protein